jgi:hypothetical protein
VPIRNVLQLDKHWSVLIRIHQLFHLHHYLTFFDNESKLPLGAMAPTASKLCQRLHNEGLITQGITMEWYCERLWKIPLVEDEDMDQFEIYESIRIRTKARSS